MMVDDALDGSTGKNCSEGDGRAIAEPGPRGSSDIWDGQLPQQLPLGKCYRLTPAMDERIRGQTSQTAPPTILAARPSLPVAPPKNLLPLVTYLGAICFRMRCRGGSIKSLVLEPHGS
jgi:hypothetical protein